MCIEMTELEGKKEETDAAKKIIHTYPLIRVSHDDMTVCFIYLIYILLLENIGVIYIETF
jgi:hypothetical protein